MRIKRKQYSDKGRCLGRPMTSPSRTPAIAWGCLAALTWGLTGTFIKLLPSFTTIEVLSIRILIALSATLIIFLVRPSLRSESLTLIRKPSGVLLSSLMVLYYLFAVRAFQLAPVSDVTLMVGLSPMMGLAFKVTTGKPLVSAEIGGALTAFVGLVMFVLPKLQGVSGDRTTYLIGLLFALLAACVSLGYAALFKQYSARYAGSNPIVVACTTFAIGSAVMAPMAIATSPDLLAKVLQPKSLKIALGLGIISTIVPTFCYSYAAKHLPPILTTTLNLLVPIFASVLAFLLLGETVPPVSIGGALLILVGIAVLSSAKPKAAKPLPPS